MLPDRNAFFSRISKDNINYAGARGIVPSVMETQSGYDTLPILNQKGELALQPLSNNDVDR